MATVLARDPVAEHHIKTRSIRARRLLRTEFRICAARATAVTGSASPRRSTSTCGAVRRVHIDHDGGKTPPYGAPRDLRPRLSATSHPDRALPATSRSGSGSPCSGGPTHHPSTADEYATQFLEQSAARRASGRDRPAQRKNQLQGPRALAATIPALSWSAIRNPKPLGLVRLLGSDGPNGDAAAERSQRWRLGYPRRCPRMRDPA